MADLDDALNSASIELGPHQIMAQWREAEPGDGTFNTDTPVDLTKQNTGFAIGHSLDDGLPDPVTMTTSVDAAGTFEGSLAGREGLTLASTAIRAYDGTGGSWDSASATKTITAPLPPAIQRMDLLVACVLVDDSTASIVQNVLDPVDSWQYGGMVTDAPLAMYVFYKRRWRGNVSQLSLISDKNVDFISQTIALGAVNQANMRLDWLVPSINMVAETVSTTTHSAPTTLNNRGYQILFGGAASGNAWTAGAGLTAYGNQTGAGLTLLSAISAFREAGPNTLTATQASANATAVLAAISVEPYERPRMSATQYFSEFNDRSPVYGFDRDTADVTADLRVLGANGPVDTRLFAGRMQGIDLGTGTGEAVMSAISKTRIRLNRSLVLPVVSGFREGLTVDWLVTWLAARGSQFVGPAPNRWTRYWAPLHGSIHAHWGPWDAYNTGIYISDAFPAVTYGYKNMKAVDGPFLTGMFAQQGPTRMDRIRLRPLVGLFNKTMSTDDFPHIVEQGGPFLFDIFSQRNSKGRLNLWIRGDAVTAAPAYLTGASEDYILYSYLVIKEPVTTATVGWVAFGIDSANRRAYIQMGSDAFGVTTVTYAASGLLPTDGAWHYVGFWWDFAAGQAKVRLDGGESSSGAWATNGNNVITGLPNSDGEGIRGGYDPTWELFAHLPISEVMLNFGEDYSASIWSDNYPASGVASTAPGGSMTMRFTRQYLAAIAEAETVNAWDTLAGLARATLSMYRTNEADNLEFLPAPYFGETAQNTPAATQSTRTNSGAVIPYTDPTKTRNVVTVQYNETRVDSKPQPVLLLTSSVEIPAGTSLLTFSLDVPCVEIHGVATPNGPNYQVLNLTSAQITTPSLPLANHFISPNSREDGFGTIWPSVRVSASIVTADASSVTLRFVNNTGAVAYLMNSGDQVPAMQILGYAARSGAAYSTASDSPSVRWRGERGLDAEMYWIHNRPAAADISARLLSTVSVPRPQISFSCVGDPRRKPGQMITVLDPDGTAIAGNWRIIGVTHNTKDAQYTQDILAIQILPTGLWDGLDGWDDAVWG